MLEHELLVELLFQVFLVDKGDHLVRGKVRVRKCRYGVSLRGLLVNNATCGIKVTHMQSQAYLPPALDAPFVFPVYTPQNCSPKLPPDTPSCSQTPTPTPHLPHLFTYIPHTPQMPPFDHKHPHVLAVYYLHVQMYSHLLPPPPADQKSM